MLTTYPITYMAQHNIALTFSLHCTVANSNIKTAPQKGPFQWWPPCGINLLGEL